MKKLSLILALIMGVFLSPGAKAQNVADYYPGKWIVAIAGTPNGDVKMTFCFERKDGKLTGTVQDSTGTIKSNITSIEEKYKTITAYYTIMGYDLSLVLAPIDDDHVKGSLLGLFAAQGVRVKQAN
jgi:hypothetical protein